jgi:hypothetical protein
MGDEGAAPSSPVGRLLNSLNTVAGGLTLPRAHATLPPDMFEGILGRVRRLWDSLVQFIVDLIWPLPPGVH